MRGRLYKNGPRAAASTPPSGPFSRHSHARDSRLRHQPLGDHEPQLLLLHHGHPGCMSHLRCGDHHGAGGSEVGKWTSPPRLSFLIYVQFPRERVLGIS